jgi:P27 family predicted phage terminase small subunit
VTRIELEVAQNEMRGRLKPTAVQIAEGDPAKKGVKKLDAKLAAEPKAQRGLPGCPRHLLERAREAWDFWKLELEKMRLDCAPDSMMLEGACVNYSRAVDADIQIQARGIVLEEPVIDREGMLAGIRIKKNPAVEVSNQAWRNVRAFCSEFGLSPAARTRLTIEKQDDGSADLMGELSKPRTKKEAVQ